MKREIRFRAWNTALKEMWYPETLTADKEDTFFAIYNDKKKTIGWGLYDRRVESRICSGEYDDIMQFIGRKDKNGKEIYEGDIISNGYGVGVVYWNNDSCAFKIRWVITALDDNESYIPFKGIKYTEVIGNIYENPELIK